MLILVQLMMRGAYRPLPYTLGFWALTVTAASSGIYTVHWLARWGGPGRAVWARSSPDAPGALIEDGWIPTLGEPNVGHAAIRSWRLMMDTDNPILGVRHVLMNFRFTTDAPDRAAGTMHITAYLAGAPEGQATVPFAMGTGTDNYRRTADGWKVTSRTFTPHFPRK